MTHNGTNDSVAEFEGRLDMQLADMLETVFSMERDWRVSDHIDTQIRYAR